MPGYDAPVIMAAGAFVQGSSIELSADGPIKPPYAVYFQGGLTWYHAKAWHFNVTAEKWWTQALWPCSPCSEKIIKPFLKFSIFCIHDI